MRITKFENTENYVVRFSSWVSKFKLIDLQVCYSNTVIEKTWEEKGIKKQKYTGDYIIASDID